MVTAGPARPDEVVAQVDACTGQNLAVLEDPVLVGTGHEVAPVLGDRRFGAPEKLRKVARSEGDQRRLSLGFEDSHVDPARRRVAPGQRRRFHDQRGVVPERQPEVMELPPQIGPGLRLGGVWPKHFGQPSPELRHPGMEDQIRGERGRAGRGRPGRHIEMPDDELLVQQSDLQHDEDFSARSAPARGGTTSHGDGRPGPLLPAVGERGGPGRRPHRVPPPPSGSLRGRRRGESVNRIAPGAETGLRGAGKTGPARPIRRRGGRAGSRRSPVPPPHSRRGWRSRPTARRRPVPTLGGTR